MTPGIAYATLAYVAWGLFPLYFRQVAAVPAFEVVLHRTLWSLVFVLALLAVRRQWAWMRALWGQPRVLGAFALSALLLVVMGLDYFKRINDELGHLGGDEVLRSFARVAQENVRAGDLFGRYGGEEFLLIFPATSPLPALNTCECIRAQVESHFWKGLPKMGVSSAFAATFAPLRHLWRWP
ncbi:diguanylate cyclase [Acidovorax soli]|uniref:diguanylate cyclase n=1 Tax=Acidovorax soli TaxID=592050 RepID=UPI0026EB6CD1|nr:diguanylate cyclase [Acidovorax soli]